MLPSHIASSSTQSRYYLKGFLTLQGTRFCITFCYIKQLQHTKRFNLFFLFFTYLMATKLSYHQFLWLPLPHHSRMLCNLIVHQLDQLPFVSYYQQQISI